ncbi:MAG: hypothetical protein MI723_14020 [Caulobacterales bacterium]|nr:hypothetical protein [Caulobacterales bacterium]
MTDTPLSKERRAIIERAIASRLYASENEVIAAGLERIQAEFDTLSAELQRRVELRESARRDLLSVIDHLERRYVRDHDAVLEGVAILWGGRDRDRYFARVRRRDRKGES